MDEGDGDMVVYTDVKQNTYFDSVTLMMYSSKLSEIEGIKEAAVMMGSEHNKALMIRAGLLKEKESESISPNDLVTGIGGEDEAAVNRAVEEMENLFASKERDKSQRQEQQSRSLEMAKKELPSANMAVISVPGQFAAYEAKKALRQNLNVLLFSDHVSLEQEISLKNEARNRGLLMMGPDCGTAIINGVSLGFANVVRRGTIGIAAAAGTGLQEVTTLIDRMGGGISQAIGTGGRDLSDAVGGRMMLAALDMLEQDVRTTVVGVISKPPSDRILQLLIERLKNFKKPVAACMPGIPAQVHGALSFTDTLEDMAALLVGTELPETSGNVSGRLEKMEFSASQKYVRGLYSGGTLCYEALVILKELEVYSNIAKDPDYCLIYAEESKGNTIIDMGDDYFTDGLPHPMIDFRIRADRIVKEAEDEETAVIMLDCVLGFGAHEDPAGELAKAVRKARERIGDRTVCFLAAVCGTGRDVQNRTLQEQKLAAAGVLVYPSNARMAKAALRLIKSLEGKRGGR